MKRWSARDRAVGICRDPSSAGDGRQMLDRQCRDREKIVSEGLENGLALQIDVEIVVLAVAL
jgi:hypothetical protein